MIYVLLTVIICGVLVLGVASVVGYFNSGAKRLKAELRLCQKSNSIALDALAQIASGDAMPIIRAADAIKQMTRIITTKELN